MTALGGAGKRFGMKDTDAVHKVGSNFKTHAEELQPHAKRISSADVASAFGPWADAAKGIEEKIQTHGKALDGWSKYCDTYGQALHDSVVEYKGTDTSSGEDISKVF